MNFKQVLEIATGQKTETRRVAKDTEYIRNEFNRLPVSVVSYTNGKSRIKWEVGRDYAVVPKRGHPGVWYNFGTDTIYGHRYESLTDEIKKRPYMKPLRIQITELIQERLQAISRDDAWSEGINMVSSRPITGYRKLWESINKTKGERWIDNPMVWVIKFEVLR